MLVTKQFLVTTDLYMKYYGSQLLRATVWLNITSEINIQPSGQFMCMCHGAHTREEQEHADEDINSN